MLLKVEINKDLLNKKRLPMFCGLVMPSMTHWVEVWGNGLKTSKDPETV